MMFKKEIRKRCFVLGNEEDTVVSPKGLSTLPDRFQSTLTYKSLYFSLQQKFFYLFGQKGTKRCLRWSQVEEQNQGQFFKSTESRSEK
jgi:hypothetical protein